MKIEMIQTIGEIAANLPRTIPFFEERGIDYCCGGKKSLQEACVQAGVPIEAMIQILQAAAMGEVSEGQWTTLPALIQHLVDKHHVYTRSQLALVSKLGSKVLSVHGHHHPELAKIVKVFEEMAEELVHHMMKEEQVAFPFLIALEQKGRQDQVLTFEMFQNGPRRVLMADHEMAGDQLKSLRVLTGGYVPPADACVTFRAFYQGMKDLEADLHRHIHLENNVLFPMAEKSVAGKSIKDGRERSVPLKAPESRRT